MSLNKQKHKMTSQSTLAGSFSLAVHVHVDQTNPDRIAQQSRERACRSKGTVLININVTAKPRACLLYQGHGPKST